MGSGTSRAPAATSFCSISSKMFGRPPRNRVAAGTETPNLSRTLRQTIRAKHDRLHDIPLPANYWWLPDLRPASEPAAIHQHNSNTQPARLHLSADQREDLREPYLPAQKPFEGRRRSFLFFWYPRGQIMNETPEIWVDCPECGGEGGWCGRNADRHHTARRDSDSDDQSEGWSSHGVTPRPCRTAPTALSPCGWR